MVWALCFRALEEMFLANGARIGYWRGSIEGVIDDLQVPALWLLCASRLFSHRASTVDPRSEQLFFGVSHMVMRTCSCWSENGISKYS